MPKYPSRKYRWPTVLDLYSGSGAVTAALKKMHFKVVAAIDNDPVACQTFRSNHPQTRMIEGDIRKVNPNDIRKKDLGGRNLDLLVVCAPCQPFSSQNKKRKRDPRSRLILEAGRFARVLKPKAIFFENVPGLAARSNLLRELRKELGPDYVLGDPARVDAADFGVPQRRVRCIMVATRGTNTVKLPEPLTPKGKQVTVNAAIKHLVKLKAGESDPSDPLHASREHHPITLRRLMSSSCSQWK